MSLDEHKRKMWSNLMTSLTFVRRREKRKKKEEEKAQQEQ
jgi:hypothetical protein